MGAVCSIINKDFVFVPERDIDNTRTVMTRDGQVRVYSRSRRGTQSRPPATNDPSWNVSATTVPSP